MLPAMAQFGDETIVERVDIRGNRRIPEDTIRANIVQIRPGEPYDESKVEFDLRSLYRTNYFENLEVQEKDGDIGKVITFVVREKPLIRSIEYVGNKSFTESDILDAFKEKKLGLTVDSQYDPVKVKMAERLLHDLMVQSGKPLGSVHSEVEPFPPYSVRVRFVVDEGTNVRIGKIRFTGNKVFDDSKLRAALQMSKERSVFTMFKGLDKYHREKLEYDIEMNLKAFYQQHGYMQVQFGQPVTRIFEGPRGVLPFLRKTKEQFFVEIPIDAGDQYRLGKLELKECGVLSCEALQRAFGMKEGDILNFKAVKDTLEQFKKLYGEVGYINFSYLPEHHADPKTKVYDLTLTMQPDKQFFVRRINFLGNTKTRDKVIRREFILEEGKVFSSIALDNSVLRLNQLGYFEQVEEKDYEVKPDEKTSMVDVDIKLKEKSQQSIGFSGGISGISGSFIGLNYSTNNFLGRGESLDVNIMGGTRQTNYSVTFTEPYLFDTRWNMGLQIYNQRYRYDTYSTFGLTDYNGEASELFTQKTTGGTLTISRRLPRSLWTVGTSYTYQKIGVSNIATGFETFALGQFIGYTSGDSSDALEGITRSEITPMVSYNSTNAYFNATAGKSLNVSAAIAGGILGGDFNMVRPALEYRHFIADRWLSHGRNVFAFNLQLQYTQAFGNSVVPFFDRFFIGGENTIRGFDIRSISPLAVTRTRQFDGTSSGNCVIDTDTGLCQTLESSPFAVGGDAVGILNFEYRIPIAGPLSMSGFYDIGITRAMRKSSLGNFGASEVSIIGDTNNKLRSSTGVELQFVLPVVSAPFRLIFAYNPQRLSGSVTTPGGTTYTINEPSKDVKFTVGRSF
jgi:outer membrane protein insertion porin family